MKKIGRVEAWIRKICRMWDRFWNWYKYSNKPILPYAGVNNIYQHLSGGIHTSNHVELEFTKGVSYIVGKSWLKDAANPYSKYRVF